MAERDLSVLLKTLEVKRHEGVWRFVTYKKSLVDSLKSIGPASEAVMIFKEAEGTTIISPVQQDTAADNRWVWLELSVYSDLQVVGFMAKVAEALAAADVPCNSVAAFHHDHIFVPEAKAEAAIVALEALAKAS